MNYEEALEEEQKKLKKGLNKKYYLKIKSEENYLNCLLDTGKYYLSTKDEYSFNITKFTLKEIMVLRDIGVINIDFFELIPIKRLG